jgi:hypothetical protein
VPSSGAASSGLVTLAAPTFGQAPKFALEQPFAFTAPIAVSRGASDAGRLSVELWIAASLACWVTVSAVVERRERVEMRCEGEPAAAGRGEGGRRSGR